MNGSDHDDLHHDWKKFPESRLVFPLAFLVAATTLVHAVPECPPMNPTELPVPARVISTDPSGQVVVEVILGMPLADDAYGTDALKEAIVQYAGQSVDPVDYDVRAYDSLGHPTSVTADFEVASNTLIVQGTDIAYVRWTPPNWNPLEYFGQDMVDGVVEDYHEYPSSPCSYPVLEPLNWQDYIDTVSAEVDLAQQIELDASLQGACDDILLDTGLPEITLGQDETLSGAANYREGRAVKPWWGKAKENTYLDWREVELILDPSSFLGGTVSGWAWVGHAFVAKGTSIINPAETAFADIGITGGYRGLLKVLGAASAEVHLSLDLVDCGPTPNRQSRQIKFVDGIILRYHPDNPHTFSKTFETALIEEHRYLIRVKIRGQASDPGDLFTDPGGEDGPPDGDALVDFRDEKQGGQGLHYDAISFDFVETVPPDPPSNPPVYRGSWQEDFEEGGTCDRSEWIVQPLPNGTLNADIDAAAPGHNSDCSFQVTSPYLDFEGGDATGPSVVIPPWLSEDDVEFTIAVKFDFRYDHNDVNPDYPAGLQGVHWFQLLQFRQIDLVVDKVDLPLRYRDDFGNVRSLGTKPFGSYAPPNEWHTFWIKTTNKHDFYSVYIGENTKIGDAYRMRDTGRRGFHFRDPWKRPAPCEKDFIYRGYYDNLEIRAGAGLYDCQRNGTRDDCDLSCAGECAGVPNCGLSQDLDSNFLPDECQLDCNGNGVADPIDVDPALCGSSCSQDQNTNGIPDECEADCDGNGIPDDWDISQGALDCDGMGIPDHCEMASNNCCSTGQGTGCNDAAIQACVCAIDSYCCDESWDEYCADAVRRYGCGFCEGDANSNGTLDLCEDVDGDGLMNSCDQNDDGDHVPDVLDNCPTTDNHDQRDTDHDGRGDACDTCPFAFNPDQVDSDDDGIGDCCDSDLTDFDLDGVTDACDNCPTDGNTGQRDWDLDGVGSACDNCLTLSNPLQERLVFAEQIQAIDKDTLGWTTLADVDFWTGDLSLVGTYGGTGGSLLNTATWNIAGTPAPGDGFYYLVAYMDPCGSWQTASDQEPGRDGTLIP